MSDELERALEYLEFASESLAWTRQDRDEHILAAFMAGASYPQIAEAAGLSRQGVLKIVARIVAKESVDNSVTNSVESET